MSDAVGRLRQLGDNATEDRWIAAPNHPLHGAPVVQSMNGLFVARCADDPPNHDLGLADAEFIAAARNVWDALLDAVILGDTLSGYARHEDDCDHKVALREGRGLSQGGAGAPCNCGFLGAMDAFAAALDRLDKETPS